MTPGPVIRRLLITLVLAILAAALLIVFFPGYIIWLTFAVIWPLLFFGWSYWGGRVVRKIGKASALQRAPVAKRSLWLRLFGGVAHFGLTLITLMLFGFAPLLLCYWKTQRAHDKVRVGMTVAEVLHSVKGWEGLQVISHVPDPEYYGGARPMLAVSFGNTDGGFEIYDVSTHQSHEISETEAIALFHGKLCEGCGWHFLYIYEAMNQDVHFTVGFNPNGQVIEVGSPGFHGW